MKASQKALAENLKDLESSTLPPHLKAALEKHYRKSAEFGIDPNFFAKCKAKAEKAGDDFALIHGVIA